MAPAVSTVLRAAPRPRDGARVAPTLIAAFSGTAVSKVNVTVYGEYDAVERIAAAEFERWRAAQGPALGATAGVSMETTHGLLRALGPPAFAFVSGIVSRLGHFDDDVPTRAPEADVRAEASREQNAAASFNAGVVVAAMLARLDALF